MTNKIRITGAAAATHTTGSCGWHPDVPVRLYAARADRDSVIANARHCQAALAAHGAHVPVIDVGPVDHNHSLALALPQLLSWFQHLS